jgi:hypothetical protein
MNWVDPGKTFVSYLRFAALDRLPAFGSGSEIEITKNEKAPAFISFTTTPT